MSTPHALLAYDSTGAVVATLDHMVARDDDGNVVGLIDFDAHEAAGGRHRDIWVVSNATGSGTWPEFLGSRAHEFAVELDGTRITALVHKASGHRREREAVATTGSPTRHLVLDEAGRTAAPLPGTPGHLPILGGGR